MDKLKVFTAFHKNFELPANKDIFIPVQVWKEKSKLKLNMIWDNTWDNISYKNQNYCEITMLYWIWKNYDLSDIEYIWLSHYRRLFKIDASFLSKIKNYDIILPKKELFSSLFFNMSLYQHYCFCHIKEDIDIMIKKVLEKYPLYEKDLSKVLFKRNIIFFMNKWYFFNMFIMKKEIFYEYCDFIFDILFELEKEIKISWYNYQSRVFWFLSERLLNIFVEYKKNQWYKIFELDIIKK